MRAVLFLSAALIAAPAAFAQSAGNDQYQGGDAVATTTIDVGSTGDAGATAVASGNVVTASNEDSVTALDNTQHMDGATHAEVNATVWNATGGVAVASAAVANGATVASVNGGVDADSRQFAHGDATAVTRFNGGDAAYASSSASAAGNVGALSIVNGEGRFVADQESTGSIGALVEADHCCISGAAVSAAIASANNIAAGGDTATIVGAIRQSATGDSVAASVDLYAGYASDASGNAIANGNAVTIDNEWGYVNADVDQRATADVSAESYVTLGGDFLGIGAAGAYGVGNQTILSNVGSDTVLDVTQDNAGMVTADAAIAGEGGAAALVSAAAYGNNVTGSLCSDCDMSSPTLSVNNDQRNSGDVRASATAIVPSAGSVAATASAIGNSGTFVVRGPGG